MADIDWHPGPGFLEALTRLDAGEVDGVVAPQRQEIIDWAVERRYQVIIVANPDDPIIQIRSGDGGLEDLPDSLRP